MLSRRERKAQADKQDEPLEVDLTVSFRFGDEPDDKVTMIDNRRVPMVGSVFEQRDAMVRNFVKLLLKAGLTQPKVLGEIVPALKLIRRKK
jgi:hypothetical protein